MPQSETCTSCNRTYSTYHLVEGKCRICRRKEDNAHDLDMLTDDEYEEVMGVSRGGRKSTNKQHKRAKSKQTKKEEIMNEMRELSDEDFLEILNQLE